jgi:hypothetical protein
VHTVVAAVACGGGGSDVTSFCIVVIGVACGGGGGMLRCPVLIQRRFRLAWIVALVVAVTVVRIVSVFVVVRGGWRIPVPAATTPSCGVTRPPLSA